MWLLMLEIWVLDSPASDVAILVVGSVDKNDEMSAFSNFGKCVSLFAPWEDIESSFLNYSTKKWSGTSMAAPHVTGIVALLLSQYPDKVKAVKDTFDHVKMIATKNASNLIENSVDLLTYYGFVEGEEKSPALPKLIPYSKWTNLLELDFIDGISSGEIDVNQVGPREMTPFIFAIYSYYYDAIPILLGKKANVNAVDVNGNSALHWAVSCDKANIIILLIEFGSEIYETNFNGRTALHFGASEGSSRAVEALIKKGADVNTQDKNGRTPIILALQSEHLFIAKSLLRVENINLELTDDSGGTPLHYAVLLNDPSIIQDLISKGAEKDVHNKIGDTPLQETLINEKTNGVISLIHAGVDINVEKNGCGCKKGYANVVEALILTTIHVS